MAQTGYTPILIYSSSTTTNAPAAGNLTNSALGSELAINITDGKLFYKDNANAIQVIGWKTTPTTAGGTGLTSYTAGDILYASGATTLSKLADVATGNALISGGVGVAPSWGKIGLTTHVSGTLPTANGGTNLTSFTANGVLYASSTGALATGNVLNFDGTNLLVGTTSNGSNSRIRSLLASSTDAPIEAANDFAGSSGLRTFYSALGNGSNSVANTNCYHLVALSQGSAFYYLYGNGTTSFTSDFRLKKNIETTRDGYAEDLCKLRVVKYQWNTEPDEGGKELGLIAQEVEQVFPGLIQDATEEIQGFKPKVLKASVLPFMLLKAIQEQQDAIKKLQEKILMLENK